MEYKAKCGHTDLLGYFANTYCAKCARDGHKKALGINPKKKKK